MDLQKSFKEFITYNVGQKEIALVVFKDQIELKEIKKILKKDKFVLLESIENFNEAVIKAYFVLDESFSKSIYDFIKQYPTGSVEVFNTDKMEARIIKPDYEKTSLVFLVSEDKLKQITNDGFDFISIVGMCYRNN